MHPSQRPEPHRGAANPPDPAADSPDPGPDRLDFLRTMKPAAAMEYLMGFDGVGPKTAQCVLLFSFGMAVFPVDTHIYRIAGRLGVLDKGVKADRAHETLAELIAPRRSIRHARAADRAWPADLHGQEPAMPLVRPDRRMPLWKKHRPGKKTSADSAD